MKLQFWSGMPTICLYVWPEGTFHVCKAFYTGHIIHDASVGGGGPKLECAYLIDYYDSAPYSCMLHHLHQNCGVFSYNTYC